MSFDLNKKLDELSEIDYENDILENMVGNNVELLNKDMENEITTHKLNSNDDNVLDFFKEKNKVKEPIENENELKNENNQEPPKELSLEKDFDYADKLKHFQNLLDSQYRLIAEQNEKLKQHEEMLRKSVLAESKQNNVQPAEQENLSEYDVWLQQQVQKNVDMALKPYKEREFAQAQKSMYQIAWNSANALNEKFNDLFDVIPRENIEKTAQLLAADPYKYANVDLNGEITKAYYAAKAPKIMEELASTKKELEALKASNNKQSAARNEQLNTLKNVDLVSRGISQASTAKVEKENNGGYDRSFGKKLIKKLGIE
ncbi:MAG: hypothetical protein QXL94_00860 [Candidatus Parvarchaeum sp.]